MNIHNARNGIRRDIDAMTVSVNRFVIVCIVVTVLLSLLWYFTNRSSIEGIAHAVELVQAILAGSTALMGLSGLMMIEIGKTNITGLTSDDGLERVDAINRITSLARSHMFLRWVMLISLVAIVFCGLRLMNDNPMYIIGSIATFLVQVYLFLWGLIFSNSVPWL